MRIPGSHLAATVVLLGLALAACATSSKAWTPPRDTRDDPAALRPGYGNRELHTWWPLTAPEVTALRGIPEARAGDAHALLALALLASGDHRDAASTARAIERVDRFVADVRPAIAGAADDWHRGYELNRAMHRTFFGGERSELGNYEFEQAHLTRIFLTGKYNCLSSTLLYVVLARAFDLPVRAVSVPTHVFVEMGAPGSKLIEVETTSDTGFDWVHDQRFYRNDAASWSSRRGLRPVTFEEYQQRKIIEPFHLVALAMRDGRAGDGEVDRMRLRELAGLVDDADVEAVRERMQAYGNEALELYNADAWRTMAALFDTAGPAVAQIGSASHDPKTLELASWATWYHAYALSIVGRADESLARMNEGFAHLDPTWPDADKLRANFLALLSDRLRTFIDKKDYAAGVKMFTDHGDVCRADKSCANNASVVYRNWSVDYQNAGDWPGARKVLQACVAAVPADAGCQTALTDLESQHRF